MARTDDIQRIVALVWRIQKEERLFAVELADDIPIVGASHLDTSKPRRISFESREDLRSHSFIRGRIVSAIPVPGEAAHVEKRVEPLHIGAGRPVLQPIELSAARRPVATAQVLQLALGQSRREAERKGDLGVDVVDHLDLGGLLAKQDLSATGEGLDVDFVRRDERYELVGQVELARRGAPDVLLEVDAAVGENGFCESEDAIGSRGHTLDKAENDGRLDRRDVRLTGNGRFF